DDLRCELGCYGSKLAKSPNIDKLAAAGVRFDRAYCQFPLCNPSRSSMLTGRYPLTTGVFGNRDWFGAKHPDFVTLPRWFKEHGYVTMRTGKIFHEGIDDTEGWTVGGEERRFGAIDSVPKNILAQQAAPPDGAQGEPEDGESNAGGLTRAQRSDRLLVFTGEGERSGDYRNA